MKVKANRSILDPVTKAELLELKKWRRDAFAKGLRRRLLREKALKIRAQYDAFTQYDVPLDKWMKLAKACGDFCPYGGKLEFFWEDEIEDMDEDDFFGKRNEKLSNDNDDEELNFEESATIVEKIDLANSEVGKVKELKTKVEKTEGPKTIVQEVKGLAPIAEKVVGILKPNVGNVENLNSAVENVSLLDIFSDDEQTVESVKYEPSVEQFIDFRAEYRATSTPKLLIGADTVAAYLHFLNSDEVVERFLRRDYCNRMSDKYLLAVVCVYFARARLPEFNRDAFFKFLYLANETHEDEEETRYEILACIFGEKWRDDYSEFMDQRLGFWRLLNYETIVFRRTVEQLFLVEPQNPIWKRERTERHAGATRWYIREQMDYEPRGFFKTPDYCESCVSRVAPAALPTKFQQRRLPLKKRQSTYNRTPGVIQPVN